jgi:hypothetical protein
MRDARNGREGCFPGEGIVRDDVFGLDRLVMQRDKGRRPLSPSYGSKREGLNSGEGAFIPGEATVLLTRESQHHEGKF